MSYRGDLHTRLCAAVNAIRPGGADRVAIMDKWWDWMERQGVPSAADSAAQAQRIKRELARRRVLVGLAFDDVCACGQPATFQLQDGRVLCWRCDLEGRG